MNAYLTAFIGSFIMFLSTALGAGLVLFFKNVKPIFNKISLAFASGIMVAASVWSLLLPSINFAEEYSNLPPFVPAGLGLILGVAFLLTLEIIIVFKNKSNHNFNKNKKRSILLFSAVTLHNIPEGMAVGLTFALACSNNPNVTLAGAFALAIGMSIQNIPEGSAISLPIYQNGAKKSKAFMLGAISGIVEPISALITVLLVGTISTVLPYLLAFAAGAMLFVVVNELLPESQCGEKSNIPVIFFILGFLIMMVLDVALG